MCCLCRHCMTTATFHQQYHLGLHYLYQILSLSIHSSFLTYTRSGVEVALTLNHLLKNCARTTVQFFHWSGSQRLEIFDAKSTHTSYPNFITVLLTSKSKPCRTVSDITTENRSLKGHPNTSTSSDISYLSISPSYPDYSTSTGSLSTVRRQQSKGSLIIYHKRTNNSIQYRLSILEYSLHTPGLISTGQLQRLFFLLDITVVHGNPKELYFAYLFIRVSTRNRNTNCCKVRNRTTYLDRGNFTVFTIYSSTDLTEPPSGGLSSRIPYSTEAGQEQCPQNQLRTATALSRRRHFCPRYLEDWHCSSSLSILTVYATDYTRSFISCNTVSGSTSPTIIKSIVDIYTSTKLVRIYPCLFRAPRTVSPSSDCHLSLFHSCVQRVNLITRYFLCITHSTSTSERVSSQQSTSQILTTQSLFSILNQLCPTLSILPSLYGQGSILYIVRGRLSYSKGAVLLYPPFIWSAGSSVELVTDRSKPGRRPQEDNHKLSHFNISTQILPAKGTIRSPYLQEISTKRGNICTTITTSTVLSPIPFQRKRLYTVLHRRIRTGARRVGLLEGLFFLYQLVISILNIGGQLGTIFIRYLVSSIDGQRYLSRYFNSEKRGHLYPVAGSCTSSNKH